MNHDQLMQLLDEGFHIPSKRDESKLIIGTTHFKGMSLYPSEYNRVKTYTVVFPPEYTRLGVDAFTNIDNAWYKVPILADTAIFKKLYADYSNCMFLKAIADNPADADKLVTVLQSLSTTLKFNGPITKTLNRPGKRLLQSWTIMVNKNTPYKVNLDNSLSFLADLKLD